jgi:integrase/recombinase XerD
VIESETATSVATVENALRLERADGGMWQLAVSDAAWFGLVNDYLGYLVDRNYSQRTVRAYRFDLLAFCRWLVEQGLAWML